MKAPRLVLCPDDPYWAPPDDKRLDHYLQSIQLSGQPLSQSMHFLPGQRFLDLIASMGCSPAINLQPGEDNDPFVYICIQTPAKTIEFHRGDHTHTPRCRACRSPVDDWQSRINTWLQGDAASLWECSTCHWRASPWSFNWRKSAGFGRCFIEITNIFPKEALPQTSLLDTLHAYYGVKWHYFYQN